MGAAVVVHSVDRPAGNLDDLRCPVVSRRIFRSLTTGVASVTLLRILIAVAEEALGRLKY
jgi:hypothetical protein